MNISITQRISLNKQKIYHTLEWGKGTGQHISTGIFSYSNPKDQKQRNHNKEALPILEAKRSQMVPDRQAVNCEYIPQHKKKDGAVEIC